jgi:sugar phosphate isomerase/epimerase
MPARGKEDIMQLGICSYSFHRLLAAGKLDIFKFITDCRELGCTQLDPWNGHFVELKAGDVAIQEGRATHQSGSLSPAEQDYVARVRQAGDAVGLPFGSLAMDGAHIYESDPQKRAANRECAYRWIEIARRLGARQIRVDPARTDEFTPEILRIIIEGYHDLIARARRFGIEILIENHMGLSAVPDNVIRILESVDGLGFLYDTHNWKPELREEGRRRCARYASYTHIKTFEFDQTGSDPSADIESAIKQLLDAGYSGTWGIESCPRDDDEYAGARKTIALIRRVVEK